MPDPVKLEAVEPGSVELRGRAVSKKTWKLRRWIVLNRRGRIVWLGELKPYICKADGERKVRVTVTVQADGRKRK